MNQFYRSLKLIQSCHGAVFSFNYFSLASRTEATQVSLPIPLSFPHAMDSSTIVERKFRIWGMCLTYAKKSIGTSNYNWNLTKTPLLIRSVLCWLPLCMICQQTQRCLPSSQHIRCYGSHDEDPKQYLYSQWCGRLHSARFCPLIVHSFPCLPVQSSDSDDTERDMDLPGYMSRLEFMGNDTKAGLDQDENENS